MLKNKSFAFKMSLVILIAVSSIFIVSFLINYINTRQIVFSYVEQNARQTAYLNVYKIEDVLNRVEKIPLNLAHLLEYSELNRDNLNSILQSVVYFNEEIYGSTIAFDGKKNKVDEPYFAPYFFMRNGMLNFSDLSDASYDYHNQDWYKTPKDRDSAMWVEPYFDEGAGNVLMTTYSVPFYLSSQGKKIFRGIVTADISLVWLDDIVSSISILNSGFAFLISNDGIIISHPNHNYIMKSFRNFISNNPNYENKNRILTDMLSGKEGVEEYESIHLKKPAYLFHTQLPSNNWTLALVFPKDELYSNIDKINNYLIVGILVGLIFITIVVIVLSQKMTKPLHTLSEITTEIAKGNFNAVLPTTSSNDEVGKLTNSMGFMLTRLNRYIKDLKSTTAEKERYESELRIAHNIQMGMIPKTFPPFPEISEIDVFAKLKPAREVGGDLYDFFFLDEDNLCLTIGDVSGKGVPASLLMAVTRTLLHSHAKAGLNSSEIMNLINKSLNDNKESRLFVTYFLLIFNIRTGLLDFTNAGHNPPLLVKQNNEIIFIDSPQSYPLGISTLSPYKSNELLMNKGDKLFLYTDGITEAQNSIDETYGEERLKTELANCTNYTAKELCNYIFNSTESFISDAEQYDDMTVVCLNYLKG
ncbi:MAG: SpoIIE family protein phosphatase [Melioribacteraceae bacterium]|nr:SpoIIE family protein phosphatase [Melioribacteraceae bacterium]